MMQAIWKHKGAVREGSGLGLFSLIDAVLFGFLMPLFAPLADLFLLLVGIGYFSHLLDGAPDAVQALPTYILLAYLTLPALDILTAVIAFRLDPYEDRRLLFLLPFQRLFYRQLLYFSVLRAMWRAATGRSAKWSRTKRASYQCDLGRLA